jgi:DHA2 family multidrug resistance protein
LIARRSQLHQLRLVEKARVDNPNFANAAQNLAQHFGKAGLGLHESLAMAYAWIYQSLLRQSVVLAYIDSYMVLAIGAAIMFFLSFLLKKNDPGGGRVAAAE